MKQQIIPASVAGYVLGEIRQDNYAPGQPAGIVGFGIGESGQVLTSFPWTDQGSEAATGTVLYRATAFGQAGSVANATDAFHFNMVTYCPKHEGENWEVEEAVKYASQNLGSSFNFGIFNSLGGFIFQKRLALIPDLAKNFKTAVIIVTGNPGSDVTAKAAKALADAKVTCWIFTAENDKASGTSPQASTGLHSQILANGGTSYLTVYAAKNFPSDASAHQVYFSVIPAWYKAPSQYTLGTPTTSPFTAVLPLGVTFTNLVTEPKMHIYDFLLNPGVDPRKTLAEQLAPPPVVVVPDPVVVVPPPVVPPPVVVPDPPPVIVIPPPVNPPVVTIPKKKVFLSHVNIWDDPDRDDAFLIEFIWIDAPIERRKSGTVDKYGKATGDPAKKGLRLQGLMGTPKAKNEISYTINYVDQKDGKKTFPEKVGPFKMI